ncbi:hypothetical protein ACIFOT_32400 [Neobacillus sp. NRS-1170]|uniref:hypothetical protein n=1 Tax=Neobacillus sp. NRS-1170 TaxID=3233898 RepID=UPI003D2DEDCA
MNFKFVSPIIQATQMASERFKLDLQLHMVKDYGQSQLWVLATGKQKSLKPMIYLK